MIKKILILGSTGMMGSTISKFLRDDDRFKILCTYRNYPKIKLLKLKKNQKIFLNVYISKNLNKIIKDFSPHYIINCIGLVKQLIKKNNLNNVKYLNISLPKKISKIASQKKIKVIHLSTDCVYSGKKGNYKEINKPDAKDFYGKSKLAGEVKSANVLNIRTSIIGDELLTKYSLFNWFISQKSVYGFKNAFFSGLTTLELSKIIIDHIILNEKISNGLYNISGPKISKLNLLKIIKRIYKTKTIIKVDNGYKIDRSLNSLKFRKKVNLKIKAWSTMINEQKIFNENF